MNLISPSFKRSLFFKWSPNKRWMWRHFHFMVTLLGGHKVFWPCLKYQVSITNLWPSSWVIVKERAYGPLSWLIDARQYVHTPLMSDKPVEIFCDVKCASFNKYPTENGRKVSWKCVSYKFVLCGVTYQRFFCDYHHFLCCQTIGNWKQICQEVHDFGSDIHFNTNTLLSLEYLFCSDKKLSTWTVSSLH